MQKCKQSGAFCRSLLITQPRRGHLFQSKGPRDLAIGHSSGRNGEEGHHQAAAMHAAPMCNTPLTAPSCCPGLWWRCLQQPVPPLQSPRWEYCCSLPGCGPCCTAPGTGLQMSLLPPVAAAHVPERSPSTGIVFVSGPHNAKPGLAWKERSFHASHLRIAKHVQHQAAWVAGACHPAVSSSICEASVVLCDSFSMHSGQHIPMSASNCSHVCHHARLLCRQRRVLTSPAVTVILGTLPTLW